MNASVDRDVLNVLIVYGTTEGQTRKIAEWTAKRIRERGHQAKLLDSAALESDLDLDSYDAIMIAASVHQVPSRVNNQLRDRASRNAGYEAFGLHIRQSIRGVGGGRAGGAKVR